jgi:hypothetical protein
VERCRSAWKTLAADANDVLEAIEAVEDEARRRRILPGHLHDLLEKHGLRD